MPVIMTLWGEEEVEFEDTVFMNIEGEDIEFRPAIVFGKTFDNWLVSRCAKVYSVKKKKILTPYRDGKGYTKHEAYAPKGFWEDDSGRFKKCGAAAGQHIRNIRTHKMVMDTWMPLYDNPPEGVCPDEWKIARDMPTIYEHINKTIVIDHIDDNPSNNRLDNLRRTTQWANNHVRKKLGLS